MVFIVCKIEEPLKGFSYYLYNNGIFKPRFCFLESVPILSEEEESAYIDDLAEVGFVVFCIHYLLEKSSIGAFFFFNF